MRIGGPVSASTNCCLVVGRGGHRVLSINSDATQTTSGTIIFTGGTFSCMCTHVCSTAQLQTFSKLQKSADYNWNKHVCLLNLVVDVIVYRNRIRFVIQHTLNSLSLSEPATPGM